MANQWKKKELGETLHMKKDNEDIKIVNINERLGGELRHK